MPTNLNSMKLDKSIVERRIDLMAAEGIVGFFDIT
jgi:NADPH-dependent glutamate synthase beta subunit-like oxidoreductase